jgi:hypothetical protein
METSMDNALTGDASRMFFRLTYLVRGARLRFQQDEFRFQFMDPLPVEVSLRPPGTEATRANQSEDAICRVDVEREPGPKNRAIFEQLSRGELPEDYGDLAWIPTEGEPANR